MPFGVGVGIGIGIDWVCPVRFRFFSVDFRNVQGNRLRRTKQLVLRVAVSGQRLTEPIHLSDALDGGAIDVQFLVSKCHADFLSTPIPTPPPIFCRSVLFLRFGSLLHLK